MQDKRKALGKGLDELGISDLLSSIDAVDQEDAKLKAKFINVDVVTPNPYQPRKHFSPTALKQLADSIKAQGLLQPIVVRPGKTSNYELIAGERRLRACQSIGLKSIPAIIKNITDQACLALAVIENIQRQDLNVVELAQSLHALASKYGMTHAEVGRIVGKSRAAVSNLIRLLQLCDTVKNHLVEGLIEMGHARCLLSLSEDQQAKFAKEIIDKQLSVRDVEQLVKHFQESSQPARSLKLTSESSAYLETIKQEISKALGLQVHIKPKGKEGGVVSFTYENRQSLQAFVKRVSAEMEEAVV